MPRPRPHTLNLGLGGGHGGTLPPGGLSSERPNLHSSHSHSHSHSNSNKGIPTLAIPPGAPLNSPNSSHGNTATPMPTPPPSHGRRSQAEHGQPTGALYDPFNYRPRLPPQDKLSQKWSYQARHLMRAQQALIAAQNDVLRIEQDLMWTEREMFEKERRLAENGELPEEDDVGGEGVLVEKSEKSGGSGKPNRLTQPPRPANANFPRKYGAEMYMPGQFPSPTGMNNGGPGDKMSKQIVSLNSKENAEPGRKDKPLPLRQLSSGGGAGGHGGHGSHGGHGGGHPNMRHSYHPGMPPIRSNSMTSDSSHDSDAKAVQAAERERIQHAKFRQEYEKIYGSRASSRGYNLEADMRKTLGGDFNSPTSEDEEEDDNYEGGYDRYYPGQYTEQINASKKEKRRPEMLSMKSGGGGGGGPPGFVDKWVQGSAGGGGGNGGGGGGQGGQGGQGGRAGGGGGGGRSGWL